MKRSSTWFTSILIASALLLNGVKSASSQPAQSPESRGAPKSQSTQVRDQNPKTEQNQATSQPTTRIQQTQATPKNTPGTNADEEGIQKRIETFTGLLVLVGALQFVALIIQAFVFFCTLTETQKVNRIAQRGYLYVANAVIRTSEDHIWITYRIYNAGVTPLRLLRIAESFDVSHTLKAIKAITVSNAKFEERRTVIPPNSEIGISCPWDNPLGEEELRILNASGSVFFYGILEYEDIFNQRRYFGFGLRTKGKIDIGNEIERGLGFIAEEGFNWFT